VIVVSDTSPLRYLALLGESELLPKLFGIVAVPLIVLREMQREETPAAVRAWAEKPTAWLEVHDEVPRFSGSLADLDPGECAAIQLAEKLSANLLLIDEGYGRRIAKGRKLAVMGLVGILALAARGNLISFDVVIARLRETNFRISDELIERARVRSQG
jgi:predicted nucleic acid-binding protein